MAKAKAKAQPATIKPIALARQLGMRPQQIFQMVRNGTLPSSTGADGHIELLVADIIEYLENRETLLKEQLEKVSGYLNTLR